MPSWACRVPLHLGSTAVSSVCVPTMGRRWMAAVLDPSRPDDLTMIRYGNKVPFPNKQPTLRILSAPSFALGKACDTPTCDLTVVETRFDMRMGQRK